MAPVLALLLLLMPTMAQEYAPSNSSPLLEDPANGIPVTRELSNNGEGGGECGVVEKQIAATDVYVAANPQYAPQLNRFRETYHMGRIRRGTFPPVIELDEDGEPAFKTELEWKTLPDLVEKGGGGDRWIPPGGRAPGSEQILPPNILIANDDQLDGIKWCDPDQDCWFRAHAILTAIHEGGRQLQSGTMYRWYVLDPIGGWALLEDGFIVIPQYWVSCSLLAGAVAIYAADIAILNDFIDNGVPMANGERCQFTTSPKWSLHAQNRLVTALEYLQDLCDEMADEGCPPSPHCS